MKADISGAMPRAIAARAVDSVVTRGRNLDRALADADQQSLNAKDQSLAAALAYGAVRNHCRNRQLIRLLINKPLRARDSVIEALISVGLYALTESRSPDYAVVSATVAAAAVLRRPQLKGVVNAVMRRFLREREELLTRAAENEEARWLHPQWLLDSIRNDWPENWEDVAVAANTQAPMWLRINLARTTRAQWIAEWTGGPTVSEANILSAVCLPEPVAVDELPGFAAGECSVQDVASQAAALLLDAQPGMRVLDACAAPGGKAAHILEECAELEELVALDQSAARLEKVEENLARLGLQATVLCGDAAQPEDWWDGKPFDRILLDAPCSATGVIRRHPDIRLLRQPDDIESLAGQQFAMLRALWPLLKPGGLLVYSTCSLLRAENEAVVGRFLAEVSDAREKPIGLKLPAVTNTEVAHGCQLLPGYADNDGFYYALMERYIVD